MKIQVVTPDGPVYEQENIEFVQIPTKEGIIGIYEDHESIITLLDVGEVVVRCEERTDSLSVSTGIAEVHSNTIRILADTAERAEKIDVTRAEEALKRAQEYLEKDIEPSDVDIARIQAQIAKESARIQIGRKYKNIQKASKAS